MRGAGALKALAAHSRREPPKTIKKHFLKNNHRQHHSANFSSCASHTTVSSAILCQASQSQWEAYLRRSSSNLTKLPGRARIGRTPYEAAPRGCTDHQSESLHSVTRLAQRFESVFATKPAHLHFKDRCILNQHLTPAILARSSAVLVACFIHII